MSEFIPQTKGEWPAFPSMHYDLAEHEHGLTIRDYFAAKAMQAIFSNPDITDTKMVKDWVAASSYAIADAMMEARK